MMRGDNNLKDASLATNRTNLPMSLSLSYTKTNKLITALYMVTDVMDINEPIRHKLRFLGSEIISDINSLKFFNRTDGQTEVVQKISEILSFLDIASAVFMISPMNASILKKEFGELRKDLDTGTQKASWLSDFLVEENAQPEPRQRPETIRVGVQKGSTLLKAIKDISMSNRLSDKALNLSDRDLIDSVKKKRREEIKKIIINNNGIATISDIKQKAIGELKSCGEKTIQRELALMVKDNVLKKEGEKRWVKYRLDPNA